MSVSLLYLNNSVSQFCCDFVQVNFLYEINGAAGTPPFLDLIAFRVIGGRESEIMVKLSQYSKIDIKISTKECQCVLTVQPLSERESSRY